MQYTSWYILNENIMNAYIVDYQRTDTRYGIAAMNVGSGHGTALLIEMENGNNDQLSIPELSSQPFKA
jgi:hypothetical protein